MPSRLREQAGQKPSVGPPWLSDDLNPKGERVGGGGCGCGGGGAGGE